MPTDPRLLPNQPALDYAKLEAKLRRCKSDTELFQTIVNAPFDFKLEMAYLFLGIISLVLYNPESGLLERVALSDTELAADIAKVSPVPHQSIASKPDDSNNLIARAIRNGQPLSTDDWKDLLTPALTVEAARINQAAGGIACSYVYPLKSRQGALCYHFFQYQEGGAAEQPAFMDTYTALVDKWLKT